MISTNENNSIRKALLILNQNYKISQKLDQNLDSIDQFKLKLEKLNFQVEIGRNLLNEQIDFIIDKFLSNINSNDFILFYYYGYGINYLDENYFIGINDEHLETVQLIKYEFINLNSIIEMFNKTNPSSIIYLFEFFNPNQFSQINSIEILGNQFIILICQNESNQMNLFEKKSRSLLLNYLIEYIDEKYLSINQIFDLISNEILYLTNNQIIPWKKSLLRNNLYFNNQITNEINEKRLFLLKQIQFYHLHFDLTKKQIKDSHMKLILEEFLSKKSFKKVYFDQNEITSIGLYIFSSYLNNNNHLEGLYLNDNQIGDIGIKYLTNSLINNKTLKYLSLQKNQLTDISIEYFSNLFQTNQTLICLSLDFNRISDKGVQLLFSLTNLHLKYIGLSNNIFITDLSLTFISQFIQTNRFIEDISLFNCHLSKATQLQIQKVAKKKTNFSICLSNWNE